jgi:hypothetical protein
LITTESWVTTQPSGTGSHNLLGQIDERLRAPDERLGLRERDEGGAVLDVALDRDQLA